MRSQKTLDGHLIAGFMPKPGALRTPPRQHDDHCRHSAATCEHAGVVPMRSSAIAA
jgi:hypothetical protein